MSGLDRDAQALIARARRTEGPSPEDRARLRARLQPVWAAYRAQQQTGSGAELLAGSKSAGVWGRGSLWVNSALLTALLFMGPRAAPELRAPSVRTPNVAARPGETALERAARVVQPPLAAREALGALDPTPAQASARALGSPHRERPQVVSAAPPRAAADARAIPSGTGLGSHLAAGTAPRARVPAARANLELARREPAGRAAAEPAPQEHSALERRAERAGLEVASGAHAPSLGGRRPTRPGHRPPGGVGERAGPREVGPVQRDPGFAPQPIDDELSWLAAAQRALREGRAEQALRLVQEHAFRFPRGALAPERIAVQALALCALDRRSAARAVLEDLARVAPGSPLLQGVERKCGDGL